MSFTLFMLKLLEWKSRIVGLVQLPAKKLTSQGVRGFESHLFRQFAQMAYEAIFVQTYESWDSKAGGFRGRNSKLGRGGVDGKISRF